MNVIYRICNTITGENYIGETTNISNRIQQHFNPQITRLNRLHYDILTLGRENFEWEIIKELHPSITKKDRELIESKYMHEYDSIFNGYNITYYDENGNKRWKEHDMTDYSKLYSERNK